MLRLFLIMMFLLLQVLWLFNTYCCLFFCLLLLLDRSKGGRVNIPGELQFLQPARQRIHNSRIRALSLALVLDLRARKGNRKTAKSTSRMSIYCGIAVRRSLMRRRTDPVDIAITKSIKTRLHKGACTESRQRETSLLLPLLLLLLLLPLLLLLRRLYYCYRCCCDCDDDDDEDVHDH